MTEPEHCAECGFDSTRLTVSDAIVAMRSMGRRWREAFDGAPDDALRLRPAPKVWSPLEYAAHTRDVILDNTVEMSAFLEGRKPDPGDFEPETPDEPDVDGVMTAEVLHGLAAAADAMARKAFDVKDEQAWERTPGGDSPTAGYMLKHALHDASHHLRDVEKALGTG